MKLLIPTIPCAWSAAAFALAFSLGAPLAMAASDNWKSTSTDANWSNGLNWNTGAAPGNTTSGVTASTDVATFNSVISGGFGSSSTPLVIDAGRTILGITFGSSAGAYKIGADSGSNATLYLSSGGTIQKTTGSGANQTIAEPLKIMGSSYTFSNNASGSSLQFNAYSTISGGTAATATVLTLDGTNVLNTNRLYGAISNGSSTSLSIVKNGTGAWALIGGNTFTGGVTLNQGTLNIRGGVGTESTTSALGTGTFTIAGGAIDNTNNVAITNSKNNAQAWNGNFTFIGTQSLNLGTGAVTMNATRTVTTTASTLTIGGAIGDGGGGYGLTKSGAGILALSGANTYTGDTTVSVGTLLANTAVSGTNSATGSGAVSVSAILGGTGQITPGAGKQISVTNGGTISPGAGLGTLTVNGASTALAVLSLASGANFAFDLNSTGPGIFQSDKIALMNGTAGDISFGGNAINFTDMAGGTLAHGAYTLFSASAADNYTGLTVDGSGIITGGLTIGSGLGVYTGSTLQVVNSDIVLNVVPEPTTWALLAFSLTTVMVLRRRRV